MSIFARSNILQSAKHTRAAVVGAVVLVLAMSPWSSATAWDPSVDLGMTVIDPLYRPAIVSGGLSDEEALDTLGQFHPLTGWPLVNVGLTAGEKVNVQAETSLVGSVRFELTGAHSVSRTDNYAPYTLFEDIAGSALPAGSYQISATAYSQSNQGGIAGTTRTATFTLVADTTGPSFSVACGDQPATSNNLTAIRVDVSEPALEFSPHDDISVNNVTMPSLLLGQRHPSSAWIYEFDVEPEPTGGETTLMIPAGVARDEVGNSSSASNTLHIARNRKLSVADASATEGSGQTVDFEVTLDHRNDCETVTVNWATVDGTATAGTDYTAASGTLTFGPGELSKAVSIAVLDDEEDESDETFTLSLSNASGATFADSQGIGTTVQRSTTDTAAGEATGTIRSDDSAQQTESDTTPPAVMVTSQASEPVEGGVQQTGGSINHPRLSFDVTVTFSEPTSGFQMSELEVSNGIALSMSSSSDGMEHTVAIGPDPEFTGQVTVKVPAGVANDAANNPNTASAVFGIWSIGRETTASGPPVPTVACYPRTSADADHSFDARVYFNQRIRGFDPSDAQINHPASVWPFRVWSVDGGVSGNSMFSIGGSFYTTSSNTPVTDELELSVSVPAGIVTGSSGESNPASNTLHIALNRRVSAQDASATEGTDATLDFDVSLGGRDDCETVTVDWATVDGTATAGEDYIAARGTLIFGPGENSKTIRIPVLNDSVSDDGETVTLRLSDASGATIDDAEAVGTIADGEPREDDPNDADPPTVTVTSEATGPVSGEFDVTVKFSEPISGFQVSDIQVFNGSVTSMSGFSDGTGHTVTIAPNSDAVGTLTVTVPAGVATDSAGNANSASEGFGIAVDTVSPSVTVAMGYYDEPGPVSGADEFALALTFSEPISDFDASKIEVTNGSVTRGLWGRTGTNRYYIAIVADPAAAGTLTVTVPAGAATDSAGNLNTASTPFEIAVVPVSTLPVVSIAATSAQLTEGDVASFTLSRTGDTADALTVEVNTRWPGRSFVTRETFAAGSSTAHITRVTEDLVSAGVVYRMIVEIRPDHYYAIDPAASQSEVIVSDRGATPTGLPTISGTARVGETLTASESSIADADGLANTTFSWQWVLNDGTADIDIAGATAATYTLAPAETGKTVKVRATFTDDGGTEETLLSEATAVVEGVNSDPTGLPTISGTARVGETLTASASEIADADGLTGATFSWQWIANDGTADADIAGATDATYTLTPAETGKTIKIRVIFADDGGTEETLESAATAAVEAGLTARFENVPVSHDGASAFNVYLRFSEAPANVKNKHIKGALTITGGKILRVRVVGGVNGDEAHRRVEIEPDGDGDVQLSLLPTTDCAATNALCTEDGEPLSETATVTVPGPDGEAPLTASFEDAPESHDGASAFNAYLRFSEAPADVKNIHIKGALTITGGKILRVRVVGGVNGDEAHRRVEIEPDGDGDVQLSLLPTTDCAATNALCTADGRPLSQAVSATIPGPASQTRTVSIAAANDTQTSRSGTTNPSQVTEGAAAAFTLTRTGSLADALTVNVSVTETGTMLSGTVPETVTFNANSSTAELRVETEDDEVAEPASTITATLAAGSGYSVDTVAASGSVTVEDDDAAPVVQTAAMVLAPENTAVVVTLTATDDDTPVADLAWSIAGGADAAMFTVSAGGDLAFASAKDFEAPDDADGDGDYEVAVRVTDGSNPADAALTVRLTDVDDVSPVLTDANVNGDALVLTFGEPLDGGSVPAPSAFSATVDGAARGVSDVSIGASSVTLTLASAVAAGETVTVGYTVPTGANAYPLRDAAENAVAGFSNRAVTNATAAVNTAPTGLPTISGTAQVGETLTASSAGISDADGLTNVTFAWQWVANDGTSDADIAGATAATYTLTAAEAGKTIKLRATFTDDAETEETLISEPTAAVNTVPTGLPVISGTAQVGETLTASSAGISDADGLTNATYAWQWIANDGTSDADIAGATGVEYTLTPAQEGNTVKVRVTFTDDGGTEETLVSEATAAVTVALPSVSVAAVSSPVTEGTAAAFRLSRTGDTVPALTVAVSVTVDGAVVSATPASSVTFATGSAEATLSVATVDDSVAEADARVSVALTAGSDYLVDSGAGSATVDVYDNDEVASAPVKTLWTSTIEWQGDYGAGWVNANEEDFSSPGWSEDGNECRIWYMAYGSASRELWLRVNADACADGITEPETLTLHVGDVTVGPGNGLSDFARRTVGVVTGVEADWTPGEQVELRLTRTTAGETTVTGPGVSVADAQVQEAEGAVLAFRVTLAAAQTSAVSVRYATSDGSATAGTDYVSVSGALRFAPGETSKTVSVPVLNDAHDEGSETLTLTLSSPFGAQIADGTATGTIVNTDPIPKAWIARFGRTVAEQVIDAVEARMRAPRSPGVELSLAGQRVGGSVSPDGTVQTDDVVQAGAGRNLAEWFGNGDDPERRHGPGSQTMTQRDLLLGSSFSFTGGTPRTGTYALWGRGAVTRFDGREDGLAVDGEVTSGMLGADWSRDALMAGLVVSHSLGEGGYRGESGNGGIASSLTGLYPWGRYALSDRVSVWGLAGYGEGTLTVTPEGEAPIRTDLDLTMAAAGLRGVLVQAPETGGFELAVKTDAMGVRTSTAKAKGLEAEQTEVTRLRLGLEGSRSFRFEGGASLTPSVEIGARHDGGDAETGFGVDMGGGVAWSDPLRGLSAEIRGRGLLSHAADGFRERGFSGSLSWDPTPGTARGLSFSMSQTVGAQASGGVDALFERNTLAGLATNDNEESEFARRRFDLKLGYGLPAFGDRFTSTPEIGFGFSGQRRDYSLGWRLTREGRHAGSFDLSLEAQRQESANDNTDIVHEIGFRLTARF